MREIYLHQLNKTLRLFLSAFLISLTVGVSLGLVFLFHTTSFNKDVTTEKLIEADNQIEEDFGIDESESKTDGELLMTTHNHIIGFSFIFFFVGGIFYFNSTINGFWKMFFLVEPILSTILSFGSLWGVRLLNESFIYVTIISSIIMYFSLYFMVSISLFELLLKQRAYSHTFYLSVFFYYCAQQRLL